MDYWYTDIDIRLLLKHEVQEQDTYLCHAITLDVQQASKELNDTITIFSENESIKTALIPIILGKSIEGVFIGSHWTALVLINNHNTISALFADPLGQPIEISAPIIYKLLQNFQITLKYNSTIKQQNNEHDCGPLTVFNLLYLSRFGPLPTNIEDTYILKQRILLGQLKERQLTRSQRQIISIPDNYKTSGDFDILDCLPKSHSIPENDKTSEKWLFYSYFLSHLNPKSEIYQKMLNARESYMRSHDTFKTLSLEDDTLDILQSIPSNEVTEELINTNLDSQNRQKEMKRKDMKKLIEMVNVIDSCIKNEMQLSATFIRLGNISGGSDKISFNDTDENCIRNKYGYSRRNKNASINQNGIYFEKLYQIKLVLEETNKNNQTNLILDDLEKNSENLNRDLKNIKMIILSILNEEKEFLPEDHKLIIPECKEPIDSIMEHIINLAIIHYYPMILDRIKQEVSSIKIFNIDNMENRYYIARILTIIGELSREYIEHNTRITNDDIREMFRHFQIMRNLFTHCHDKIITGIPDDEQRVRANNNISYILNGLNECIENRTLKTNFDYKIINENIQSLKQIFTKSNVKSINQNSSQISQQIPINENVKSVNDRKSVNKNKTEIIKLIKQAQKILSESPANISDLLERLDEKYQISIRSLNEESSDQYPPILNATNSIIIDTFIKNLQQTKISKTNISTKTKEIQEEQLVNSNKLVAKIEELVHETEYLIISERLKLSRDSDRSYVIEHIVSVIGQIMRDISDLNSKSNSLQTSHIHDSASKSAVSSRNQGLAHDIFAFDKNWLDKQILDNILPAYEHFQAILTISKKDDYETSRMTLLSIACSFLKLGFFDNAVDYFRRTLEYIEKHPQKIESKTDGGVNIFQTLFNININSSFEELMGIDIFSLTCRKYLSETYMTACKYDEAFKELEMLKKNMQIHRIMESKDEFMSGFVSYLYETMVNCLLIKGRKKDSFDLVNEIISISNDPLFKLNLARTYHFNNNYEEAYKTITDVLPSISDPIHKYYALFCYVRILSYQPNKKEFIIETNRTIKEMDKLFEDYSPLFKKKFDDESLIIKSFVVRLKVQSLVDKTWLLDNNERDYVKMSVELEDHIIQYHDIIKFVKHDLQYNMRITSMYFWICRAYSALISDKVSSVETEKIKVVNAQRYFDKAKARFYHLKQTGTISMSSIKDMIKTADYLAYGYYKLAFRHDKEERLSDFYIEKAAPYTAMTKRFFERYPIPENNVPISSEVKASIPNNKINDSEQDNIEKVIVDKFIESKIKMNAKDVNISVKINKSLNYKVTNYCCAVLNLEPSDIEFENNSCWISLGHKNIEILRKIVEVKASIPDNKINDSEQDNIEKVIVDKFIESKIKMNVKDVNISIKINKSLNDKVTNYCCAVLNLEPNDIEFENNTCWISLGHKNIEILRKIVDQYQKKK